jgi:hypothetical protein
MAGGLRNPGTEELGPNEMRATALGTGIIYLFISLSLRGERPLNLTFSLPHMLILDLEQNAHLLYRR